MPFSAAALRFGWPGTTMSKQKRGHARVGEMRGNPRAHCAGSEDGNPTYDVHGKLNYNGGRARWSPLF